MRVRSGDLVLLATDGLYDNLFEEEILEVIFKFVSANNMKTKHTA